MKKRLKKVLALTMTFFTLISACSGLVTLAEREYAADVSILGKAVDFKDTSFFAYDTVFAPLKELCGYLNLEVEENGDDFVVKRGNTILALSVGNMVCQISGEEKMLSHQPIRKNTTVYIPIDAFCLAFDMPVTVSEDKRSVEITPNVYRVPVTEENAAGVKAAKPDEDTLTVANTGTDQAWWNVTNFPGKATAVYYKIDLTEFLEKGIESASFSVWANSGGAWNPYINLVRTAPWKKGEICYNNVPEEYEASSNITSTTKGSIERTFDVSQMAQKAAAEGSVLSVKLRGMPNSSKIAEDRVAFNVMGVNTNQAPYFTITVKESYNFPVKKANEEKSDDEAHYSEFEILRSLGVFTQNDEFPLDLSEGVQRQEFIRYALRLRNASLQEVGGEQFFSDVPVDAPFYNDVMTAHSLGLVAGWEGIAFRPFDNITVGEAITILGRMLNYNIFADERGGFTPGYFAAARNGDLYNGAEIADEALSFKKMFKLLEDALNAKMLNVRSYSSTGTAEYTFDANMTILTEYWNAQVIEGMVTANEYTSLAGGNGNDNTISINGKKLTLNFKPYNEFLGYNVKAYYDRYEDKLLYMGIKEYDITEIDIADIADKSGTKTVNFTYERENGSIGKESFTAKRSEDKYVIYNGKVVDDDSKVTAALLDGDAGSIRLVGDSLTVITAYRTVVVNSVNTSEEEIYDLYDAYDRSIKLKSKEYSFIDTNGKEIFVEEIAKNDVISVAESLDKALITAIVSKAKVTGAIEAAENAGTEDAAYTIAGKEYELCNTAKVSGKTDYWTDDLDIGFSSTFFLNHEGRIAGTSERKTEGIIGYLLTMGYKGSSLSKKLQAAVVIKSAEEYVVYDLADKVEIDCRKFKKHEDIEAYFTDNGSIKKQPIIFDLNAEGKIKKINTPTLGTENGQVVENPQENLVQIHSSTDAAFNYKTTGVYGGKFFVGVGDSLLVEKAGEELEDYTVVASLPNNQSHPVDAWIIGNNNPDAVVTLYEGSTTPSVGKTSQLYLVDRVVTTFDSDGMEVKKLYYYADVDDRKSVTVDTKYESAIDGFKRGDIFRFSTNVNGELHAAERWYDYGNPTTPMLTRSGKYNSEIRVSGGYVGRIYKTFVQLVDYDAEDIGNPKNEKRDDISDYEYTWHDGGRFSKIMSYEVTSAGIEVKKETLDSIRTYENVPYEPQGLIMSSEWESYRSNVWLVDMPRPNGEGMIRVMVEKGMGKNNAGEEIMPVTGAPSKELIRADIGVEITIPGQGTMKCNENSFLGWTVNGEKNPDTGDYYKENEKYTVISENTTIKAEWEWVGTQYDITFEGGEGATGESFTRQTNKDKLEIPALKNGDNYYFTKNGYTYSNWTDGVNIYEPGVTYPMAEVKTITPNWIREWTVSGDKVSATADGTAFVNGATSGQQEITFNFANSEAKTVSAYNWLVYKFTLPTDKDISKVELSLTCTSNGSTWANACIYPLTQAEYEATVAGGSRILKTANGDTLLDNILGVRPGGKYFSPRLFTGDTKTVDLTSTALLEAANNGTVYLAVYAINNGTIEAGNNRSIKLTNPILTITTN